MGNRDVEYIVLVTTGVVFGIIIFSYVVVSFIH